MMDRRRLSVCANFAGYTDSMGRMKQPNYEQRRLSDGISINAANLNSYYPGEYGSSELCMLRQKNSSLTMLIDSTNSLMRTASNTFQSLFGAPRRASYCGEPDPSVQLAPSGNSGSLYLLPNSNESSLSNISSDEQRRTVTIYDGKIPSTPSAPAIPFELMTPLDAITQTAEDPIDSFVQIVLEEPDDRPSILPPTSSSRRNSPSRHRHRNSSLNSIQKNEHSYGSSSKSLPTTYTENKIDKKYCPTPKVVEPMDFSFLEPVLRGESAAPPPSRSLNSRQNSPNELPTDDICSSLNTITITSNEVNIPSLSSSSRLSVPPSND